MKVIVTPVDVHKDKGALVFTDRGEPFEGAEVEVTPAFVKVDKKVVLMYTPQANTYGSPTEHHWLSATAAVGTGWTGFEVEVLETEVPNG